MKKAKLQIGKIIDIRIIRVTGYACWGVYENLVGYMHCNDWSKFRPLCEEYVPKLGELKTVKVFKIVEGDEKLPLDVTFGGEMIVDFACSVGLTQKDVSQTYSIKKYSDELKKWKDRDFEFIGTKKYFCNSKNYEMLEFLHKKTGMKGAFTDS